MALFQNSTTFANKYSGTYFTLKFGRKVAAMKSFVYISQSSKHLAKPVDVANIAQVKFLY